MNGRMESSRCLGQGDARVSMVALRLGKLYGNDRLYAVCQRAHRLHITTFKSIELMCSIAPHCSMRLPLSHENIRGPEYYH
jgi:hypothetical protein